MYLELTLNLAGDTDASAFYLYKPYIREDEGGSYVMKVGPDNRLYKQYLSLGKSIYSGEYVEVKGGLTQEDYIAFPADGMEEGDPTTHTMPTEDPSAEPSDGVDDSGTIGDGVDDSGAIGDSADTGPIEGGEEESAGSEDGESSQTGGVTYAR